MKIINKYIKLVKKFFESNEMKVKFDWKVNPSTNWDDTVHPLEINKKLGTSFGFRGTVIS